MKDTLRHPSAMLDRIPACHHANRPGRNPGALIGKGDLDASISDSFDDRGRKI
jgi:hypothetical protein